jgi:hypothetical protein
MTRDKQIEFFKKVKGKKIYWTYWTHLRPEFNCFVPAALEMGGTMVGTLYKNNVPFDKNYTVWINNGFEPYNGDLFTHWIFKEEETPIKRYRWLVIFEDKTPKITKKWLSRAEIEEIAKSTWLRYEPIEETLKEEVEKYE